MSAQILSAQLLFAASFNSRRQLLHFDAFNLALNSPHHPVMSPRWEMKEDGDFGYRMENARLKLCTPRKIGNLNLEP